MQVWCSRGCGGPMSDVWVIMFVALASQFIRSPSPPDIEAICILQLTNVGLHESVLYHSFMHATVQRQEVGSVCYTAMGSSTGNPDLSKSRVALANSSCQGSALYDVLSLHIMQFARLCWSCHTCCTSHCTYSSCIMTSLPFKHSLGLRTSKQALLLEFVPAILNFLISSLTQIQYPAKSTADNIPLFDTQQKATWQGIFRMDLIRSNSHETRAFCGFLLNIKAWNNHLIFFHGEA